MEHIGERIKLIRKNAKLSQEVFGNRLKITKASVSRLESGINNPSEQTLKLICQENWNGELINEDWLRTGAGGPENMYIPKDMRYIYNIGKLSNEKNDFKKFCLNLIMNLPDEYWNYIYQEFMKFKKGE